MNMHSELLIHGKDGKIQERNTYKRDRRAAGGRPRPTVSALARSA